MPLSSHITPDPHGPPTREQIERGRALYAEGFTVSRCLAACGMSLGTFYYWLGGGPAEDGVPLLPPIPRRRKVVGARRKPLSTSRVSLANRLWRTAERQARDIEERLARPAASPPERERDVRMLGILVQTLRGLSLFDPGLAPAGEGAEDVAGGEAARAALTQADLWRDVEKRLANARHLASYLRDMRKVEALAAERTAAATRVAEEDEVVDKDFVHNLARRINAFADAQLALQEEEAANAAQSESHTRAPGAARS